MRRLRAFVVLLAGVVSLLAPAALARAQDRPAGPMVISLSIDGVVDPFVADHVAGQITSADPLSVAAVLITIDTPGGLDSSMRQIVKVILNSKVSVICYTAPDGARAASAGTFIMYACPVNAMAPGTNIGAAHPVGVSGAIESDKVTNDAAAYIRALAERWGRNADFAEEAVRESKSISAVAARAGSVVDYIAEDVPDLLNQVGGCDDPLRPGLDPRVSEPLRHPDVCGAPLQPASMGLGAGFLHALFDPNLAFLFFYLGLGLIVIEVLHPGISVPGILGALLLITAFVSFGLLPVQLAGVAALVASAAFFLLELKHPGLGLPTAGGLVFLILGGLLLFDRAVPNAQVSPWLLAVVALALVGFFGWVVRGVMAARRMGPAAGPEAIVGQTGVAVSDIAPEGTARVRNEEWTARTDGPSIPSGSAVRVVRVAGLTLTVERLSEPAVSGAASRVLDEGP